MAGANHPYIEAVLAKCSALRDAGLWAPEPEVRPRSWIENFDERHRVAAALILDSFVFFSERTTRRLLTGAFETALRIPPGRPGSLPLNALDGAVFTPVLGEDPNVTDSGYAITRAARQVLSIDEGRFLTNEDALQRAATGEFVVFMDDVTISGDQFLETWRRPQANGQSFEALSGKQTLNVAYICICATKEATDRIARTAPGVRVYPTHLLDDSYKYPAIPARQPPPFVADAIPQIDALLDVYAPTLTFRQADQYMLKSPTWPRNGYKDRMLLIGFEEAVPDGTLPILWADGSDERWTPLVRRS